MARQLQASSSHTRRVLQAATRLDYSPSARPTASEALDRLQQISSSIQDIDHSMTHLLERSFEQSDTRRYETKSMLIRGLEAMEAKLLLEMKKMNGAVDKQRRAPVGDEFVEVRGLRYSREYGSVGGNTGEVMILVSAGDEYPADLVVSHRIRNPSLAEMATETFGPLPSIVPGLHTEAAADLMANASTSMRSSSGSVVQLLLDVPSMQRSKQYYLNKIESFLKNCKEPVAVLTYLGNSEKGTGNWCFKDGTISFQEVFDIHRRTCPDKLLSIQSDCSYSGQWVRECARALDSLHIPPCGHRARENGVLVRVFASCQPDQEAAEPCYSIEAVKVLNDGSLTHHATQLTEQKSTWFDSTRLVCCREPDFPCPKTTFQHLTWENAVDRTINLELGGKREGERDVWYYLILHRAGDNYSQQFESQHKRDSSLRLSDWGYTLESGEGQYPPPAVRDKVLDWTTVTIGI